MFNLLNNRGEARNPIWDTVLIITTTIIISALIFSITAASMTPPQPDHFGTMTQVAAREQGELLHHTNLALFTLGLAALPLVIYSLVLGQAKSFTEQN